MFFEKPPTGEQRKRQERLLAAMERARKNLAATPARLTFELDGEMLVEQPVDSAVPVLRIPPGFEHLRVYDDKGTIRACVYVPDEASGDRVYDRNRLCLSFSSEALGFVLLKTSHSYARGQ